LSSKEGARLSGLLSEGKGPSQPVTAAEISEDRSNQFIEAGIVPLVGFPREDTAFIPQAVMVSGKSMNYQMALSRVLGLVLWCRDNFDPDMGPAETEINFLAAFGEYWTGTGHEPPPDLKITVSESDRGRPYIVTISLTPGRDILSSGEKIELTLNW